MTDSCSSAGRRRKPQVIIILQVVGMDFTRKGGMADFLREENWSSD